jgi:hypothetical protein
MKPIIETTSIQLKGASFPPITLYIKYTKQMTPNNQHCAYLKSIETPINKTLPNKTFFEIFIKIW